MENQNDNIKFINDEGESNDNRKEIYSLNDDNYAFVPAENIWAIEKVIRNWEAVKKLWMKIPPTAPHDEVFVMD
jgi:hypothetical protein